jgi:hypothetical protein
MRSRRVAWAIQCWKTVNLGVWQTAKARDLDEALRLFKRAAAKGHAEATVCVEQLAATRSGPPTRASMPTLLADWSMRRTISSGHDCPHPRSTPIKPQQLGS